MAQPILPPERIVRSMSRTRLFLAATIRFDRVSAPIRLRDLSTSGARIEGPRLPGVGATVQIDRGALNCSGTIVWRDSKGCGVRFDEPLDLEAWMPGLAARDQGAVDELVEAVQTGEAEVSSLSDARLASAALHPNRAAGAIGGGIGLCRADAGEPWRGTLWRATAGHASCRETAGSRHIGPDPGPRRGGAGRRPARAGDRLDRHDKPAQAAPAHPALDPRD